MDGGLRTMDLKETVITLTKVLATDYASQFNKAYRNDSDVTLLKKRMWQGLKGIDSESALGAYQSLCDETPEYMPTLQSIISRARSLKSKNERESQELIERERQAALPPPAHQVDSMKMLADAKQTSESTADATQADRDEAMAKHNAIIANYTRQGFVRSAPHNNNGKCAVNHCLKAGGITSSLKGSETWYCAEHIRVN